MRAPHRIPIFLKSHKLFYTPLLETTIVIKRCPMNSMEGCIRNIYHEEEKKKKDKVVGI